MIFAGRFFRGTQVHPWRFVRIGHLEESSKLGGPKGHLRFSDSGRFLSPSGPSTVRGSMFEKHHYDGLNGSGAFWCN